MTEEELHHVTITIPGTPDKVLSPNARVHWGYRHAAAQRAKQAVHLLARSLWTGPPAERVRVVATIAYRVERRRDRDNATASLKPYFDGLVGVVVRDDATEHMDLEPVLIVRGPASVILEVFELR